MRQIGFFLLAFSLIGSPLSARAGELPMAAANVLSGPAPLAVHFAIDDPSSGVVQPPPESWHGLFGDYRWDYGDTNSAYRKYVDTGGNQSAGHFGAHVYRNPGTYNVRLRQDVYGHSLHYNQQIEVIDPHDYFDEGHTFYVGLNGNSSLANYGTPSNPFRTIAEAIPLAEQSAGPAWIRLRRGDIFNSPEIHIGAQQNGHAIHIGPYGNNNLHKPIINAIDGWGINAFGSSDLTIYGIQITTPVMPPPGSGIRGIGAGTRTRIIDVDISNLGYAIELDRKEGLFVAGCEITDNRSYGIFYSAPDAEVGKYAVIMDSKFEGVDWHLIRAYGRRILVLANRFDTSDAPFTANAFVGNGPAHLPGGDIVISDNEYHAPHGGTHDIIAMGPANGQFNEYTGNFLVQGNRFVAHNTTTGQVMRYRGASGPLVARNNLFLGGRVPLVVSQWASSPVPRPGNVFFYNNTIYKEGAGALSSIHANNREGASTYVLGNIFFCNGCPTNPPAGTVLNAFNLIGQDPQFRNPLMGDFRLNQGSPAINLLVNGLGLHIDKDLQDRVSFDAGAYRHYEE